VGWNRNKPGITEQVVDLMFVAGGMSATYACSPLDRHFRDGHMATQHFQVAASNIETETL
jgi:hypothetical protein